MLILKEYLALLKKQRKGRLNIIGILSGKIKIQGSYFEKVRENRETENKRKKKREKERGRGKEI